MSNIYDTIEFMLAKNNMYKKDLAAKTDIPYSSLISAFNRRSDSFSLTNLRKIAELFEMTIDDLVSFEIDTVDVKELDINEYPIGMLIKMARKKAKLTQDKLGEKCNMQGSRIRIYELGISEPSLKALKKIVDALKGEIIIRWD